MNINLVVCNLLPVAHSLPSANQTTNVLNGTEISGNTRIVGGQIVTNRTEFAYQVFSVIVLFLFVNRKN